jgi:hypothetical protein
MTLLSNQGEPVTDWWMSQSIKLIQAQPDFFSNKKLRQARVKLIAGTNRLQTIEGWLFAAGIVDKDPRRRLTEYFLTPFGLALSKNDPDLKKSSTWWAIHLSLCFSDRSDPYAHIIKLLSANFKSWISWKDLLLKLGQLEGFQDNKSSSLESVASGIRRMFVGDRPLSELGILNVRKQSFPQEIWLQLGTPAVNDETIIHGLALAREKLFPTRVGIDFSELIQKDLHSYLCLSPDELRQQLRRLSQNDRWRNYFGFTEAVNLNSIHFLEELKSLNTMLIMMQDSHNSWL